MKSKLTKLIGATVMLLTPLVGQNFTSVQADSSVAPYTAGTMSPLSGTLMASYEPGRTIRVYSEPSYSSPTQQLIPNGSNWKVFGTQNGFYNIGRNQWIPGEYAVYQSESFSNVGYINYVPGGSIRVYGDPSDELGYDYIGHGSKVRISQKANLSGSIWYKIEESSRLDYPAVKGLATDPTVYGPTVATRVNMWVMAKYVSFSPVYTPAGGWGQISYVPGYGVRVYQSPDTSKPTNQYLKHGTKWKIIGYQDGYYQVGKNQWIRASFVGRRDIKIWLNGQWI